MVTRPREQPRLASAANAGAAFVINIHARFLRDFQQHLVWRKRNRFPRTRRRSLPVPSSPATMSGTATADCLVSVPKLFRVFRGDKFFRFNLVPPARLNPAAIGWSASSSTLVRRYKPAGWRRFGTHIPRNAAVDAALMSVPISFPSAWLNVTCTRTGSKIALANLPVPFGR